MSRVPASPTSASAVSATEREHVTSNRARTSGLVLASVSPRRRELLATLGLPFAVVPSDVEETLDPHPSIAAAVADLAERKARAVAGGLDSGLVIGADTVVVLGQTVLGKPRDAADAERMLRALRGRDHDVITGVAVVDASNGRGERSAVVTTLRMRDAQDAEIAAYVATGEPLDKAGSYAVQGKGGALVATVDGCYANVVGLPLCETAALLGRFGIAVAAAEPVCRLPSGEPCPRLKTVVG
jgi:septum formation protein